MLQLLNLQFKSLYKSILNKSQHLIHQKNPQSLNPLKTTISTKKKSCINKKIMNHAITSHSSFIKQEKLVRI